MERLKVLLIAAAVVALLGLAWKSASNALASDEERIRARLESMVDGFNANTVRHVVRHFDRGYRDEGTGADRDELVSALQGLFFRDLTSGGENYRVEIPPAELDIAVAEGGRSARVSLRALFFRERAGQSELWWDAFAVLEWAKDGSDWEITSSSDVNHRERGR